MALPSPTRDGLRAVWRAPSLGLTEIAWRWSFAIGAGLLLLWTSTEFLSRLQFSRADPLWVRSNNAVLIAGVLAGALQKSGSRLLLIAAILVPALAILWMFAAMLGRAATLNVMLPGLAVRLRSLLGLGFLRTVVALAMILGLCGAAVLAGHGAGADAAFSAAGWYAKLAVSIALAWLVVSIWALLNWVLALAAIFANDERDAMGAIGAAVHACRLYLGPLVVTSIRFGLLRALALLVAAVLGVMALGLGAFSALAAVGAIAAVIMFYFASLDFLYIARLAAYIAIIQTPELES